MNIVDALDYLDRLTRTMPDPTINKRDAEVAESLKLVLNDINAGRLLDLSNRNYLGGEVGFMDDLSKSLQNWRQKGKGKAEQRLRALEELKEWLVPRKYTHPYR